MFSKHFESISKSAGEYYAEKHNEKICHLNKSENVAATDVTTSDETLLVESDDEGNETVTLEEEAEESVSQSSNQENTKTPKKSKKYRKYQKREDYRKEKRKNS